MSYESVSDNVWEQQEVKIINLQEELEGKNKEIAELKGKLTNTEEQLEEALEEKDQISAKLDKLRDLIHNLWVSS